MIGLSDHPDPFAFSGLWSKNEAETDFADKRFTGSSLELGAQYLVVLCGR
jgi:hypothetical protein